MGDETLDAVRSVVAEVLARESDRGDWSAWANAGLTALPVPEAHGGEGCGPAEIAVLLREAGRQAARVPVWETLMVGALTLARHGTPEQQAAILPGVASGQTLLTPAWLEPGRPQTPSATYRDGSVSGRKTGVTYAAESSRLLVTATDTDSQEQVVALVDPAGPGVSLVPASTSGQVPQHTVVLEGAPAEVLGAGAYETLTGLATAGLAVTASGVLAGARDLTAAYVSGRQQFGRALAEFQAVALQMADVYVTSRTLDLAADNAVAALSRDGAAAADLKVAAYWASQVAPSAFRTCHHLHGGMGVDVTYPLLAFTTWGTDLAHLIDTPAGAVPVETEEAKNLELTAAQRTLKSEVRSYFAGLSHDDGPGDPGPEGSWDRHGPTYQKLIKQLGDDGWMGVGWPKEYGGHGLGEVEQTIFANEAQYADVHLPSVTLQTVGPTLIRYGTDKQKDMFLSRILAGDVHFAIGYSESEAGTDLASLRTTARLVSTGSTTGDYYVVNGQKLWTTGGHSADYIWLAVRTDPDAPKHKGISILIVDTTDPGFSWTPIITADGSHHVNATYFNDVRVPVDMLVGEENKGWKLITTQLNHERVMLGPAGRIEGLRDRVVGWAQAQGITDSPDVRALLGEATAVFRVNELLNWAVAKAAEAGDIEVADASSSKVFAADQVQHLLADLIALVHRHGDPGDPVTKSLLDYLDAQAKRNLVLTFGGGVQEVQRELIAMFGLGMPRVPR
ncbi:MAG: acyl-CoA dehydrogenase [Nocardioides sp.]|uniref:acyl-CoA dehydrogenase n=1 Tax=Nocardioides sp. TaxID=35761 RepID=UPI003D6BD214